MKKWFLSVAALLIAGATFAQASFGVKVGPNFASATSKSSGDKETSKIITGVAGGVYANLPIGPQFYIQPSLMYEGKGGKSKDDDAITRLNYLTLPVDFLFKPTVGTGSWMVGVGPYFGYGISGKLGDSDIDPFKDNSDILSDGNPLLKRFDAGANIQVGYEFANGFNIGLNSELGLINLRNNGDSDNSFRNTSFGVNVGYTFGGR